jgi:diguanylate cyclase (GGDEF)-like protein
LPAAVALLLLGEAGLAGAALPLPLPHFGTLPHHFVWSLLFPMTASLAFGAGGGLISALAGPVLIPFLLWPDQGWASSIFSLCCLLWFGWIGHCAKARALSPRRWNHPALAPLPPLLATLALYLLAFPGLLKLGEPVSPLPPTAVTGAALKAAADFTLALLGARCLLKLAWVRRLLGLATPARYRYDGWVLATAAAMALLLAALVPTLDMLLIEPGQFAGVPSAETVFLVVTSAILLAGALVCCRFIEEQAAVADRLKQALNHVGIHTDIIAVRDNAAQMEHLAHHDALTGLPNRLQLKSRLAHAIEAVKRRDGVGAVLFIDLDRFKQVNDSLGHRFGDEVLQQLVQRLRHRLRESDTLARLGGDEFVAVLEGMAAAEDAALVAASLIEQAAQPFHLSDDHTTQIGCSIGIALFPEDGAAADELLHNADLALYQAKEEGRGRYCFYNREHAAQSLKRQTSNSALAEALSSGGLELYFQPVVSLVDGSVQGSEALLRWRDDSGRMLTPDQFMPMAENTALMARLGDWVLKEACRIMKGWVDDGLPVGTITVNLSSHQFKMPDLPSRIGAVLEESGLEPHRLELDITEAAVMPRGDDPLSRLRDLKSLGLRLALDDFGTGYSSFAKLGEYPVDKIKVDRKFVQEITGSGGGTAAAIVAMARLLQIPVQAEGIETEWQREALVRSQCDAGQGYLFSHPMPEDEFRSWLDGRRVH